MGLLVYLSWNLGLLVSLSIYLSFHSYISTYLSIYLPVYISLSIHTYIIPSSARQSALSLCSQNSLHPQSNPQNAPTKAIITIADLSKRVSMRIHTRNYTQREQIQGSRVLSAAYNGVWNVTQCCTLHQRTTNVFCHKLHSNAIRRSILVLFAQFKLGVSLSLQAARKQNWIAKCK